MEDVKNRNLGETPVTVIDREADSVFIGVHGRRIICFLSVATTTAMSIGSKRNFT
ncbi:MAG: hypothetical protein LBT05_04435 [Planctomycetaceae bacterium]|nr:hypothetical protein [Planctomycetaceae bacterium]